MKQVVTDKFVIAYQDELENFINKSLSIVEQKMPLLQHLFRIEDETEKIKAIFWLATEQDDEAIKHSNFSCINGDVFCIVDLNDVKKSNLQVHCLMHVLVQHYMTNLVYKKYNTSKISWLENSLASFLDGHIDKISQPQLIQICNNLKPIENLNLNNLETIENTETAKQFGDDIYLIVGKYIFENHMAKELLKTMRKEPAKVVEMGETILSKAIDFVLEKRNDFVDEYFTD